MTENQLGRILSLKEILPRFFDIKSKINVTEFVLLRQLNDWSKYTDKITKANVVSIIPQNLFQKNKKNRFKLVLQKIYVQKLTGMSASDDTSFYPVRLSPPYTSINILQ